MPNEGALKSQVNRSISHYGAQNVDAIEWHMHRGTLWPWLMPHLTLHRTMQPNKSTSETVTLLAFSNIRAHPSLLPMSTLHLIKLVQMQPKEAFYSQLFLFWLCLFISSNHKDSITLVMKNRKYVETFDTFVVLWSGFKTRIKKFVEYAHTNNK